MEYSELKENLTYDKVKELMKKKNYAFFDKGSYNLNIFGIRIKLNTNEFDDAICVAYKDSKGKKTVKIYEATTDPGMYYLHNPLSARGTAILAKGQFRGAYQKAFHQGKYKALCQRKPVAVYRDKNRNKKHEMKPQNKVTGVFGINIHRSSPFGQSKYVDKWSAGCQVFKKSTDFNRFMDVIDKSSQIYGNSFTYTLVIMKDVEKVFEKK